MSKMGGIGTIYDNGIGKFVSHVYGHFFIDGESMENKMGKVLQEIIKGSLKKK